MSDYYFKSGNTLQSPAAHGYAVVANNTANLAVSTKALYVGVTGDIQLELTGDADGTALVFKAVPAGTTLNLRVRKVWAANTTATNLVALY